MSLTRDTAARRVCVSSAHLNRLDGPEVAELLVEELLGDVGRHVAHVQVSRVRVLVGVGVGVGVGVRVRVGVGVGVGVSKGLGHNFTPNPNPTQLTLTVVAHCAGFRSVDGLGTEACYTSHVHEGPG